MSDLANATASIGQVADVKAKIGKNFLGARSELTSFLTRLEVYFITYRD